MTKKFGHFWPKFLDPYEISDQKSRARIILPETGQDSKKSDQKVAKNGLKMTKKNQSKTEKRPNFLDPHESWRKITKMTKLIRLDQGSNQIDHFRQKWPKKGQFLTPKNGQFGGNLSKEKRPFANFLKVPTKMPKKWPQKWPVLKKLKFCALFGKKANFVGIATNPEHHLSKIIFFGKNLKNFPKLEWYTIFRTFYYLDSSITEYAPGASGPRGIYKCFYRR